MILSKTVSGYNQAKNQRKNETAALAQRMKMGAICLLFGSLVGCGGNESAQQPAQVAPKEEVAAPVTTPVVEETPANDETLDTTANVTSNTDEEVTSSSTDDTKDMEEDTAAATDAETQETSQEDTQTVALDAKAGQERYEATCKVCHDTGLLQSPKIGDKEAWAPRIAKGIDTLHKHSAEGYNQMPAQATGDVSKEEVYAAVDYLVAKSS